MNSPLRLSVIGNATSLFLAFTYLLCVIWGLLFGSAQMYPVWAPLLPGFDWLSWGDFFLGLIESYSYGWYFAVVWTPIYNCSQVHLRHTKSRVGVGEEGAK